MKVLRVEIFYSSDTRGVLEFSGNIMINNELAEKIEQFTVDENYFYELQACYLSEPIKNLSDKEYKKLKDEGKAD